MIIDAISYKFAQKLYNLKLGWIKAERNLPNDLAPCWEYNSSWEVVVKKWPSVIEMTINLVIDISILKQQQIKDREIVDPFLQ